MFPDERVERFTAIAENKHRSLITNDFDSRDNANKQLFEHCFDLLNEILTK